MEQTGMPTSAGDPCDPKPYAPLASSTLADFVDRTIYFWLLILTLEVACRALLRQSLVVPSRCADDN